MKKHIFLIFTICFVLFSNIQGQGIYLKGGVNFSNQLIMPDLYSFNRSMVTTFHIGASWQIPISKKWFFEPALLFNGKGDKFDASKYWIDSIDASYDPKVIYKNRIFSLDIPLQIKYKYSIKSVQLTGALGPYIGFFLFDVSSVKNSRLIEDQISFLSPKQIFGKSIKFDTGLMASLGIEYKKFQFNINYQTGLIPTYGWSTYDYYQTFQAWSFGIGYKL